MKQTRKALSLLLAVLLLLMSLLIANRYSRSIFTRSAMKAFREGA